MNTTEQVVTTSITGTKMNRRNFNMIEILLAMAVISIGFLSVISLLSIGLKTHRKAQDNFYVSLAAETMANYTKAECERFDLSIYVAKEANYASKMRSFGFETGYITATEMNMRQIAGTKTKTVWEMGLPEPQEFEEYDFENGELLIPNPKQDRNFPSNFELRKSGHANPTGAQNAVNSNMDVEKDTWSKCHYMKWTTEVDNENIVEFDCIATVVVSPKIGMRSYSGTQLSITDKDSCGLVIRIEWPAEAAIEKRNSREFEYYVY